MQGHYARGAWGHGGGDRCPVYFVPDVKIFFFDRLRCGKTHALLSSGVIDFAADYNFITASSRHSRSAGGRGSRELPSEAEMWNCSCEDKLWWGILFL